MLSCCITDTVNKSEMGSSSTYKLSHKQVLYSKWKLVIRRCHLTGEKVLLENQQLSQKKTPVWVRLPCGKLKALGYSDVIMSTMSSQITSLTIVYSTVYSGANERKHQSSASLAFVRGIHR